MIIKRKTLNKELKYKVEKSSRNQKKDKDIENKK